MLRKYLKNQDGMGFVDLIAATLIVLVALSSMFLIILSSQIRVTQDYHYRKALLTALSLLETIKYYNRNFKNTLNIYHIAGIQDPVNLDENYSKPLLGTVTVTVNTTSSLLGVAPNTSRYEVNVSVEWVERSASILNLFRPKTHNVLLREDYYFRSQQESS